MFEDQYTNSGLNEQDQQLVQYLERMLDTRKEDAQSLVRIRERLLKLNDGPLPVPELEHTAITPLINGKARSQATGRTNMRSMYSTFDEGRAWLRPLSAIAAVLVVAIIVGSLALVLMYVRQSTTATSMG